jgi:hypothetical protein
MDHHFFFENRLIFFEKPKTSMNVKSKTDNKSENQPSTEALNPEVLAMQKARRDSERASEKRVREMVEEPELQSLEQIKDNENPQEILLRLSVVCDSFSNVIRDWSKKDSKGKFVVSVDPMKELLKQELGISSETPITVGVEYLPNFIPSYQIRVSAGTTEYRFLYVPPPEKNGRKKYLGTVQDFTKKESAENDSPKPLKTDSTEDHANNVESKDTAESTPFKFKVELKGTTMAELAELGITFNNDTITLDNNNWIDNLKAQGKMYPRSATVDSVTFNDNTEGLFIEKFDFDDSVRLVCYDKPRSDGYRNSEIYSIGPRRGIQRPTP